MRAIDIEVMRQRVLRSAVRWATMSTMHMYEDQSGSICIPSAKDRGCVMETLLNELLHDAVVLAATKAHAECGGGYELSK